MSQLIQPANNHIFICGTTQSGKTYFASRAAATLSHPVLFINIQDEKLPGKFMTVSADQTDSEQLLDALHGGAKIDLRFPADLKISGINKAVGHIITALMQQGNFTKEKPIYIAIDECQILKKDGLDAGIQVATRGLARGVRGIFITQRPALCDKTLYTQCLSQYIFRLTPQDSQYFMAKGVDFEKCQEEWERLGKYSYCYMQGTILEGRKGV